MKILVVEDDPGMLLAYQTLLEIEGHDVICAGDGEAGFALAMSTPVNLIVTDNDMPNLTGTEMVAKLRETGLTTPILMCTAGRGEPPPGISGILRKPFDMGTFVEKVDSLLDYLNP